MRPSISLLAALLVSAALAPAIAANEAVELGFGNDIASGNDANDDHYTATFRLRYATAGYAVRLEERMFTDELAGTRFDETYFGVGVPWPRHRVWRSRVQLGVLHVGQGLLGQRFQNWLHRLFDSRRLDLAYPRDAVLQPYLDYRLDRAFDVSSTVTVTPAFEGFAAPEFRTYAATSAALAWAPSPNLELAAHAGARTDHVRYAALRPFVFEAGPTFRAEATLWRRVRLAWTHNAYGLRERHFDIDVRIPL